MVDIDGGFRVVARDQLCRLAVRALDDEFTRTNTGLLGLGALAAVEAGELCQLLYRLRAVLPGNVFDFDRGLVRRSLLSTATAFAGL